MTATGPGAARPGPARRILRGLVTAAAALWVAIDVLVLATVRPLLERIGRLPLVAAVQRRVATLGPYPTLILVALPLVLLEPAKPVGLWLLASGRPVAGVAVLAVAEVLKIAIVERLYRAGRDKLLTIPWFAWGHRRVTGLIARVRALPAWRRAAAFVRRARTTVRRRFARLRAALGV